MDEGQVTGAETRLAWLPAIVVAAALAAYLTSFGGQFILDDDKHIVQNRQIRDLSSLGSVITDSRRPTVSVTLAVNYALGKLDVWGYHAFNLIVHVLAGVTLFGLVHRTLLSRRLGGRYGPAAPWLALACALIWTVHPLQTQSVTYIIQRGESLMGFFYLLTLYCLIRGVDDPQPAVWYAGAVAACALGMGSKAVMVTAPVMVLLYDRIFIADSVAGLLRRRWGLYLGLGATWLLLWTSGVVHGVLAPPPEAPATVGFAVQSIKPLEYAVTQPGVILHYLRLSFWPHPLCLDYVWPVARTAGAIIPPAMVVVALLALTVWGLRRRPAGGFVGAWFFLILAPTSTFIPLQDIAFEHRMYLPLAGVVVGVVLAVHWALSRSGVGMIPGRVVGGLALAAVTVALGYATFQRNRDYHTEAGMWQNVLATQPDNPIAHCGLGAILVDQGQFDQAIEHFSEALRVAPNLAEAQFNMGVAQHRSGALDGAIGYYRQALRLQTRMFLAHNNLGLALQDQGKLEQAVEHYRRALDINPRFPDARNNLAGVLAQQGKPEEAFSHWRELLRLQPDDVATHFKLASALFEQGELDEAVTEFLEVVGLQPDWAEAHNNLGAALSRQGKLNQAIPHFTRALQLKPDFASARQNLDRALAIRGEAAPRPPASPPRVVDDAAAVFNRGNSLAAQGKLAEAVEAYRQVLRLDPHHVEAQVNLGAMLIRQGKTDQAIAQYRFALDIDPDHAEAHYNLGRALTAVGRIEQAIAEYREAIRVAPGFAQAHINLGNLLRETGRVKEAPACYRRALELDPRNVPALCNLSSALAILGRMEEALEHVERALEIDPEHAAARRLLDTILAQGQSIGDPSME